MRSLRGAGVGTSIVLGSVLFSATSALADDCSYTQEGLGISNLSRLAQPAGASAAALAATIGNVNSVFLGQQGSAFVTAPGNPQPDQPGGGVWVRGVGGEATITSTSKSVLTESNAYGSATQRTTCNNVQHQSFAGVQVGADIARLNWNGWNVHVGGMAGYLGSQMSDNFGFTNNAVQVPFFGSYMTVSKGRFFADLMVRRDYFNLNLDNTGLGFYNQPIGAQGISVSTSAGYNFDAGNGWFIEPSAGFVYSVTSVDRFINPGVLDLPIQGTIDTDNIESKLGRLSLRVGTTVETPNVIWQPFVTATVFREFGGDVVSHYASLPNNSFFLPNDPNYPIVPSPANQTTKTSRVGTYGQYSLGLAAQFVNTGLVGFVRADYRNGENIDGWTANAGLRYSFAPETVASVMPVKAAPLYSQPTNWTGFYVGGFAGAAFGRSDTGAAESSPWVAGGIGGIELGYNQQFADKWVVGIEADIGATNFHGGRPVGMANGLDAIGWPTGAFTAANYTATGKSDWMGTIAGRVGYTWDRTLVYAKGGVAFADSSTSVDCIYGPAGASAPNRICISPSGQNYLASFSTPHSVRIGYTLGIGAEFDLGHNWSVKSEYDVLAFGRHTEHTNDGATVITDKAWVNQVKIGLNYKFAPGERY